MLDESSWQELSNISDKIYNECYIKPENIEWTINKNIDNFSGNDQVISIQNTEDEISYNEAENLLIDELNNNLNVFKNNINSDAFKSIQSPMIEYTKAQIMSEILNFNEKIKEINCAFNDSINSPCQSDKPVIISIPLN